MDNIKEDLFGAPYKQPINQKKKGNRNEYFVSQILQKWTGLPFSRVPSSGGLRWKNNASICGDVVCTDENVRFPFSVETKHLQTVYIPKGGALKVQSKIYTLFRQAENDAERANKMPMLLLRENGMAKDSYWLVLRFNDFKKFANDNLGAWLSNADFSGIQYKGNEVLLGFESRRFFKKFTFKHIQECLQEAK